MSIYQHQTYGEYAPVDKFDQPYDPQWDRNAWKWKAEGTDVSLPEEYDRWKSMGYEDELRKIETDYETRLQQMEMKLWDLREQNKVAETNLNKKLLDATKEKDSAIKNETLAKDLMTKLMSVYTAHSETCAYLDKINCGRKVDIDELRDCSCNLAQFKEECKKVLGK